MKIEVLGSGCKNCKALEAAAQQALQQLGFDEPITKVTDYGEIASYGVTYYLAFTIDGDVKTTGRVPSVEEIADLIAAAT